MYLKKLKELKKITKGGVEHGYIKSVANSVSSPDPKGMDEKTKIIFNKKREDDGKIIRARYINHRSSTERLELSYAKYPGDQITSWRFLSGEVYDLPAGLVAEINSPDKCLAKRSEILDQNGTPTQKDGQGEREHEFVGVI